MSIPTMQDIGAFVKSIFDTVPSVIPNNIVHPLDQDTYFLNQLRHIDNTKIDIRIIGYDEVFMSRPETIEALTKAIKGENRKYPVFVRAILPEGQEIVLDDIANKSAYFRVLHNSADIRTGMMIYDEMAISAWNHKLTKHPIEKEKGVIARLSTDYHKFIVEKIQEFDSAYQHVVSQTRN